MGRRTGLVLADGGATTRGKANVLSVYVAFIQDIQKAVRQVLLWGSSRPHYLFTFKTYLCKYKNMSEADFNQYFDHRKVREHLDSDPWANDFDISLLVPLIKATCDHVADVSDPVWLKEDEDTLEGLLVKIQNERQKFPHQVTNLTKEEMTHKLEELERLAVAIVDNAAIKYNISSEGRRYFLSNFQCGMRRLRYQPLTHARLPYLKRSLQLERERQLLKTSGRRELCENVKHIFDIPHTRIFGSSYARFQYSHDCYELKMKDANLAAEDKDVLIISMLNLIDSKDGTKANAVVIKGEPGTGKTTLLNKILHDWTQPATMMNRLHRYDLVLHYTCGNRDDTVRCFTSLLHRHMPRTCATLHLLEACVQDLRVLLLVDDLHELHDGSTQVLHSVMQCLKRSDFTMLCTTQSRNVLISDRVIPNYMNKISLELTGVLSENEMEPWFALVQHNYFTKQLRRELADGNNYQDSDSVAELTTFIKTHPQLYSFLTLPRNLVLLSFLFCTNFTKLQTAKTDTDLYLRFEELLINRLEDQLNIDSKNTNYEKRSIKAGINEFLQGLYSEAFLAASHDGVRLLPTAQHRLQQLCQCLDLPHTQTTSTFLTCTNSGSFLHFSYTNKEYQSYLASRAVFLAVTDDTFYTKLKRFITFAKTQNQETGNSATADVQEQQVNVRLEYQADETSATKETCQPRATGKRKREQKQPKMLISEFKICKRQMVGLATQQQQGHVPNKDMLSVLKLLHSEDTPEPQYTPRYHSVKQHYDRLTQLLDPQQECHSVGDTV